MADLLDTIDASLDEIEEQLLTELQRMRNGDQDGEMDIGVRNALSEVVDGLNRRLQPGGEEITLELVTERHEVLYARIAVLRLLFTARLTQSVLKQAHNGIQERRRSLEERVVNARAQREATRGSEAGIPLFARAPSEQQLLRNHINITAEEERAHSLTGVYQDNGIYSASRELAVIANLIRGGTIDETPEQAEERRGKAIFESRELSSTIPPVTPKPKAPEPREPEPEQPEKKSVAQTPDEIRRKLAERQSISSGRAVFGARDISTPPPVLAEPRPKEEAPKKETPEPARSGKAVFLAKDIEPVAPQEFRPSRRELEAQKKKEEEERRAGPARFEAKDLSSKPFPKKD